MSSTTSAAAPLTKQIEHLFWPPKHLLPPTAKESDRIDLLAYLDAEVYNTRGSYPLKLPYGVTVLRDRVVLEMERFSSPSRDHQTALATQFQASFAEQGFAVVVKEWANPTQKRSILRVRLKCRFAGCKFHFQINWDQNMGYWFISRRRCGIFQHSCRTHDGPAPVSMLSKRPVADSPQPVYASAKRSRMEHPHPHQLLPASGKPGPDQSFLITPDITTATTIRTVSSDSAQSETTAALPKDGKPTSAKGGENERAFAESLLELSKGKQEKDSQDHREPHEHHKPEGPKREVHKPSHPPAMGNPHSGVRTRSIILGEIPHGTQAFVQMAQTMGPSMFTHLVHGRGECQLTMSFDGEGFVLRTNLPSAPPPLPPPPPRQQQAHRPPLDAKTAHSMGPLNYPYLPPRRYPPGARNDPNVVML
mmetsp:Transcript_19479/g.41981  ORF Transcript_19479/g.41981 Transcript_19479/m.41981 type:complete len:420 (+) Transcript_19479:181-1440(+)